jgi:hypothetical protein
MNDTPKEILKKQFEIIYSKPLKERINGVFEMTELSRKIIKGRIKEKNPDISDIDLKVELFKVFYRFDFEEDELNRIATQMRNYLELNLTPEDTISKKQ